MKAPLLLVILILLVSGCRTKKATLDKKEEQVSVLQQNDVTLSEKEKVQTATVNISNSRSWSITPTNDKEPAKVVYKGDTLQLENARLEMNNTNSQESTTTETSTEKNEEDNSTTATNRDTSSKAKTKDVQSASWGLNIGLVLGAIVLIILGYIHLQKP